MTEADLKNLMMRVQAWPEAAQDELVAVAKQIESELQGDTYVATHEELQVVDAAVASIDSGEFATDQEIEAAFGKFRKKMKLVYSRRALHDLDEIANYYSTKASPAIAESIEIGSGTSLPVLPCARFGTAHLATLSSASGYCRALSLPDFLSGSRRHGRHSAYPTHIATPLCLGPRPSGIPETAQALSGLFHRCPGDTHFPAIFPRVRPQNPVLAIGPHTGEILPGALFRA
jgi:hypothetical protein